MLSAAVCAWAWLRATRAAMLRGAASADPLKPSAEEPPSVLTSFLNLLLRRPSTKGSTRHLLNNWLRESLDDASRERAEQSMDGLRSRLLHTTETGGPAVGSKSLDVETFRARSSSPKLHRPARSSPISSCASCPDKVGDALSAQPTRRPTPPHPDDAADATHERTAHERECTGATSSEALKAAALEFGRNKSAARASNHSTASGSSSSDSHDSPAGRRRAAAASPVTPPPKPAPAPLMPLRSPLGICDECGCSIEGPIFMLNDRAYCCQRHRLSAYHKGEKAKSEAAKARAEGRLSGGGGERRPAERGESAIEIEPGTTGLRATYFPWA